MLAEEHPVNWHENLLDRTTDRGDAAAIASLLRGVADALLDRAVIILT